MLSYGLSYFFYFIANFFIGMIFFPFLENESHTQPLVDFNNAIYLLVYIIIVFLQFIMAHRLFKIQRFKNGFPFLFEKYAIIITLMITGSFMSIVFIVVYPREIYDYSYFILMSGIIITGAGTIIGSSSKRVCKR